MGQRHQWETVAITKLAGRGHLPRRWFYCPICRRFTDTYGRYGRIRVPSCEALQGECRQMSIFPLFDPNDEAITRWLASLTYMKEHPPCD